MSGTQRDPEIAARKHGKQVKKAAETAAGLTAAEWLTRRAKSRTVNMVFEDEGGDKLTTIWDRGTKQELDRIAELLTATSESETQESASDELYHIYGDMCHDESMGYEFWASGEYDTADLLEVYNKLIISIANQVKAAQTFR